MKLTNLILIGVFAVYLIGPQDLIEKAKGLIDIDTSTTEQVDGDVIYSFILEEVAFELEDKDSSLTLTNEVSELITESCLRLKERYEVSREASDIANDAKAELGEYITGPSAIPLTDKIRSGMAQTLLEAAGEIRG